MRCPGTGQRLAPCQRCPLGRWLTAGEGWSLGKVTGGLSVSGQLWPVGRSWWCGGPHSQDNRGAQCRRQRGRPAQVRRQVGGVQAPSAGPGTRLLGAGRLCSFTSGGCVSARPRACGLVFAGPHEQGEEKQSPQHASRLHRRRLPAAVRGISTAGLAVPGLLGIETASKAEGLALGLYTLLLLPVNMMFAENGDAFYIYNPQTFSHLRARLPAVHTGPARARGPWGALGTRTPARAFSAGVLDQRKGPSHPFPLSAAAVIVLTNVAQGLNRGGRERIASPVSTHPRAQDSCFRAEALAPRRPVR